MIGSIEPRRVTANHYRSKGGAGVRQNHDFPQCWNIISVILAVFVTCFWHFLCWFRELAAGDEEEEDEGIEAEPHQNSYSGDVPAATAEGSRQQKGENDDLAEYELDKYDEEDAGRNFLTIFNLYFFFLFMDFLYVYQYLYMCMTCYPLVTANLGDSLAGLTVFSCNEEDPYITFKDTVSSLITSPVHI